MTDERIREFERRWKASGGVDDETALLLERMRAGDLALDRVLVAACCGHEAAQAALGGSRTQVPNEAASLCRAVMRLSAASAALIALFAAEFVLELWARETGSEEPLASAIEAARAYLRCPNRRNELAVRAWLREVRASSHGITAPRPRVASCAASVGTDLLYAALFQAIPPRSEEEQRELRELGYIHPYQRTTHESAVNCAFHAVHSAIDARVASERGSFWQELVVRFRGREAERERRAVRAFCCAVAAAALRAEARPDGSC